MTHRTQFIRKGDGDNITYGKGTLPFISVLSYNCYLANSIFGHYLFYSKLYVWLK